MRVGTKVGGRWTLLRELGGEEDLARWEAEDAAGTRVEVVAPRPHALLRPGARESFAAARPPDHPAALPELARDVVDGVPVRVRPLTRGTLAGVRLTPAEAVAIAGWLGPAVLAGSGIGGGELRPEDVAIDPEGAPRLAPAGLPRGESLARVPVQRAPEGARDARADLFGLGVTLWRAVTGQEPRPARTAAELASRDVPVPLASLAGAPDEHADAVLAGLLSPDPDARAAALPAAPTAPPRLPLPAPVPAPVLATLPAAPASSERLPKYVVSVPLRGLSADALRRVAARAGSDPDAVRRAAARGGEWALGGADIELDAQALARRSVAAGLPATSGTTVAPKVVQYWIIAIVCAILAPLSGFVLPFLALAALLVYMGAVNFRVMYRVAEVRHTWQDRARAPARADTPEGALAAVRARLDLADLPDPVLVDLRARVEALAARLDELREAEAALVDGLPRDPAMAPRLAAVRADLAALTVAAAAIDTDTARSVASMLLEPEKPHPPPRLPA